MKPIWIVENFVGDNSYEDLIEEVKKQGHKSIVLDITNHFELKPNLISSGDCVVFQGSIQLFRKLKAELPAYPVGWQTDPHYLCSNYYPYVQKYLFNDKHVFTTIAGLKHNKFWFYGAFGKEALIYVRPNGGDKSFTGKLIDLQDFDKFFVEGSSQCDAKDTDMVVVSTPKNIRWEGRFIVTSEKEILGCSTYMFQGQRTYIPSAPEGATQLVKEILKIGYYPDPVFTIDICESADGEFYLMEFNSFTSAGTYAALKPLIVKRVSEIAMAEWQKLKENFNKFTNQPTKL